MGYKTADINDGTSSTLKPVREAPQDMYVRANTLHFNFKSARRFNLNPVFLTMDGVLLFRLFILLRA